MLGDPQTRYEGVLKDILPTPEKVNDAIFYYARFEVPNPQGVLRLDMTARAYPADRREKRADGSALRTG